MIKRPLVIFLILLFLFPASAFAGAFILPSSTVVIEEEAFANTTAVDRVLVPDGTAIIKSRAFSGSSVRMLTLPSTVVQIADDAFSGCSIERIICPAGSYAERYCIEHNLPYQAPLSYPEKGLTAICPWSAGGGSDATLRAFCLALSENLDVTVTVDNVTGGGGTRGHQSLASANPDGYTLGMITFELSTYQHQSISALSYQDFDPLCLLSTDAAAITVNANWAREKGITNLSGFIQYCKAHPGEVQMGGSSAGSVWHMAGGYLMDAADIDLQMITYPNGSADAVKAAAQGDIQGVTVSLAEAKAFIGYHLTVLGVMDTQRSSLFPNVPTCMEQGYDFVFDSYRGLALPKGVDDEIRTILADACAWAVTSSEFATFMNNMGQKIAYLDSDDFSSFLVQQHQNIKRALDALGMSSPSIPTPTPIPVPTPTPASTSNPDSDYPRKWLTAICPWAAGGGTDASLRAFCLALEQQLDVTVTVDNRTGGGGVIGHQSLANANPDGYTLGMITFELSTYQHLSISALSYQDYDPLCRISTDASAITVNADWARENGITNLSSFIQYCKAHPGEVQMGGSSTGTVWHMAGGYLMDTADIDLQMITYSSGSAAAIQDAARGSIQGVTVSLGEARAFIEAGHLICLGVMDTQRSSLFPNVPTCKEQGYDFVFGSYRGLALPKGIDNEIRTILANACAQAIADDDFRTFMSNNGYQVAYLDSDGFGKYLAQMDTDCRNAIDTLGL